MGLTCQGDARIKPKKDPNCVSQRSRRGFAVVELLVCAALMVVLFALSVPAMRGIRKAAVQKRCLGNVRSVVQFAALYANEFKDYFPTWIGDSPSIIQNRRNWRRYSNQGATVVHRPGWFQWTGLPTSTTILRCPSNPDLKADPSGTTADMDYWFSSSCYIDPVYLDPAIAPARWKNELGGRVQRTSDVVFPSRKVGMLEQFVWHGWSRGNGPGVDMGRLAYHSSAEPGAVAYLDASAEHRLPTGAEHVRRYPIWASTAYNTTTWGMRGRDR